jgi:8-oxo-dGTP pyrophosphatase MutT (NUDIX family)
LSTNILLDRIASWRWSVPRFDTRGLIPWYADGAAVGLVRPEMADRLLQSELFEHTPQGPRLREDIGGPMSKTVVLNELALALREEGWIPGWRDEKYDYVDEWGRIRFSLERGAFRPLGLRSRAVHINGLVGESGVWIARRSDRKSVDPGQLDNLAAGGVASLESPDECMVRELAEEAGVARLQALMAYPVGVVHSRRREPDGVHDEVLYCYDLDLPPTFAPVNCDGEVAEFFLTDALAISERLGEMTWDAAAVTVDWLGRWLSGDA